MPSDLSSGAVASKVTLDRPPFQRRTRQTLCDRLLALPQMPTQEHREHLVRELGADFPGLRTVSRHDDPSVDLMEVISAAYEYPGALQAVYDIVSFLFRGDPKLIPIKGLVDLVDPEDLLKGDERQNLQRLLLSVDPTDAAAAFYYGRGETVRETGLDPADTEALISRLESYPGRPGRLPVLFEFVDHIAHRSPQFTRSGLHRWMDSVCRRIGEDHSAVDKLCRTTDNRVASSGHFYLVAELRPDQLRADQFFLAAWRQHEGEAEEALYQSDDSVGWNEAITITHDLMHQLAESLRGTEEERVLELIVPRALVTNSLDQREVGKVMPAAIGTHYPLVLRSFDRLEDPSLYGAWARNWRWIKQHDATAGVEAIREIESHERDMVQALRGELMRDGPPAIVLMLTALPISESLGVDAYTAGLHGGAPIMLWSRDDAAALELVKAIRAACADSLLTLWKHVFHLRLGALASTDAGMVGRHTVIVFDDYDRIPERYRGRARLRSPHPVEAR
jgi:hypothetical protein